ncbi:MAG: superoxide dismutase family protein [Oceanicaulis sp.]
MSALKLFAAASTAALLIALPACAESEQPPERQEARSDATSGESAAAGEGGEMRSGGAQAGAMEADTAEARAVIIDRDREEVGVATFRQGPRGVVVTIEAELGEGGGSWHGAHLHEVGDCSNADFTSSGGHINPDGAAHGFLNPDGPDNADLPNIWLNSDGSMRAQAYTTRVSISGQTAAPALLDADGSALVIHENEDDMTSQPIGGTGARILCGVIEAAQ